MVHYWGAFIASGRLEVYGQTRWPRFNGQRLALSLRAGGHSRAITEDMYTAQHQCRFWATVPPVDLTE